jgi:hypothetical protein
LRSPDRLPPLAAILVYTGRAALGIAVGATLVMLAFAFAKVGGVPVRDHSLGDAAFVVWWIAVVVYGGCVGLAWLADRKRGL